MWKLDNEKSYFIAMIALLCCLVALVFSGVLEKQADKKVLDTIWTYMGDFEGRFSEWFNSPAKERVIEKTIPLTKAIEPAEPVCNPYFGNGEYYCMPRCNKCYNGTTYVGPMVS